MNIKEKMKNVFEKGVDLVHKISTKNLIIIGCCSLICGAVALNFVLLSNDTKDVNFGANNMENNVSVNAGDKVDYFSSTQLSRQKARDEALEVLQSVVDSEDAVSATKEQALSEISKIADDIQLEANIETLVLSKGFEQCVAVIAGESVDVIVKTQGLLPNELAQINEIVYEQTGIVPQNVKIIEKKS